MEQKEVMNKEVIEKVEGVFEGVKEEVKNRKDICTPERQEMAENIYKSRVDDNKNRVQLGRRRLSFSLIFSLAIVFIAVFIISLFLKGDIWTVKVFGGIMLIITLIATVGIGLLDKTPVDYDFLRLYIWDNDKNH